MMKKQFLWLNLIKILAALLIVNSHFSNLWPVSALAAGGSIGNSLFFMASGYLSVNIYIYFINFYLKKVIRLYVPLIIISIVFLVSNRISIETGVDFIEVFIIPKEFWFIKAIMFFYLVYFFIFSRDSVHEKKTVGSFILISIVVIYIISYLIMIPDINFDVEGQGYFKWIFYLGIMLLGGMLRLGWEDYFKDLTWVKIAWSSLFTYLIYKLLISQFSFGHSLQFISQISVLGITTSIFIISNRKQKIFSFINNNKTIYDIVTTLSSITLEIYLVNYVVISYAKKILFPINIIVAIVGIFLFAYILNVVSNYISLKILKRMDL